MPGAPRRRRPHRRLTPARAWSSGTPRAGARRRPGSRWCPRRGGSRTGSNQSWAMRSCRSSSVIDPCSGCDAKASRLTSSHACSSRPGSNARTEKPSGSTGSTSSPSRTGRSMTCSSRVDTSPSDGGQRPGSGQVAVRPHAGRPTVEHRAQQRAPHALAPGARVDDELRRPRRVAGGVAEQVRGTGLTGIREEVRDRGERAEVRASRKASEIASTPSASAARPARARTAAAVASSRCVAVSSRGRSLTSVAASAAASASSGTKR